LLVKEFLDDSFRWINSGYVLTKGAEFSLQYRKNNIKGTFDFTYNDSEDENGSKIPEISKFTSGFTFYYYLNSIFGFGIRGRYYSERDNPKKIKTEENNKIDDYFILNSGINLKVSQNMKINFFIENLLDTKYWHPSNLPPDRYRQPGRTLRLRFLYEF
ncbi:MAG: TonB-dependent receptor, partial [Thermoanaerobaculia bacterium]